MVAELDQVPRNFFWLTTMTALAETSAQLLAAARGDREAAVAHLEAALAISQATGLRLFETQAKAELEELATPSG
jgi:hypothetical protein